MPMELILLSYNAFLTVNNAIFLLSKGFQFFKVYLTVQAFFFSAWTTCLKLLLLVHLRYSMCFTDSPEKVI